MRVPDDLTDSAIALIVVTLEELDDSTLIVDVEVDADKNSVAAVVVSLAVVVVPTMVVTLADVPAVVANDWVLPLPNSGFALVIVTLVTGKTVFVAFGAVIVIGGLQALGMAAEHMQSGVDCRTLPQSKQLVSSTSSNCMRLEGSSTVRAGTTSQGHTKFSMVLIPLRSQTSRRMRAHRQ